MRSARGEEKHRLGRRCSMNLRDDDDDERDVFGVPFGPALKSPVRRSVSVHNNNNIGRRDNGDERLILLYTRISVHNTPRESIARVSRCRRSL